MRYLIVVMFYAAALSGCATARPAAVPSQELLAGEISFDAQTGQIKYTLPEPALVRVRIGVRDGGALLRNLLDWEYRGAGAHVETWDKKDASGQVDLGAHQDLMLNLSCLPADPQKRRAYKGTIKGFRKAPRLKISFPAATKRAAQDVAVVSGVVPVRVAIDPEDNRWLVETKYEMGIFIDSVFLAEDEEGIDPYNYQLNTKGLNDGVHIITVNVVGYEGEVGTESVPVVISNEQ